MTHPNLAGRPQRLAHRTHEWLRNADWNWMGVNHVRRHLGDIAPPGVAGLLKGTARRLAGRGRDVASMFEERLQLRPYSRGLVLPCVLTGTSALLAGVLVGGALTSGGEQFGTAIEHVVYPQIPVASAARVPPLGTRQDPNGRTDAAGFEVTLATPGSRGSAQVSNSASGHPAVGRKSPSAPPRHPGQGKAPPHTTNPTPPSTPTRSSKHHEPDKHHNPGDARRPGRHHHSNKHHHPGRPHPDKHHQRGKHHHPGRPHHHGEKHHHPDKHHHPAKHRNPGKEHQP
jgi:hypothetical protein